MLYDRAIVREIAKTIPLWKDETFIASVGAGTNAYLVTSLGRFYSCKSKRWMSWWTKKNSKSYYVSLSINGVQCNVCVNKFLTEQTDEEYVMSLDWEDLARKNNELSKRKPFIESLDIVKFEEEE